MFRWVCIFSAVFILGFFSRSYGQDYQTKNIYLADSVIQVRGEVYFSFEEKALSGELVKILSIEKISNRTVFAYANLKGFSQFLSKKIDFQLQPENFFKSRLKSQDMKSLNAVYPSYPKYISLLKGLKNSYSSICKLYDIGLSVKGRKMEALKIASSTGTYKTRPALFLTSSIHGNELTGYKLLLWLSEYLLSHYGKDALVTKLVDETEIWINPLANPDGTYFGGDSSVIEATRFNANGVDLNRNFPDPADGDHPDNLDRQPETQAMMDFYKAHNIKLSANLHTGVQVVNYPWDTWKHVHADDAWYRYISRQYANTAQVASGNTYMNSSKNGFENGIVNGYQWYRITGGRQDYVNYFLGGREVTIELSEEGMPDSASLANYWEYNRNALLQFLEQSLFGIWGKVTDSQNGNSVRALVELLGYDKDNSHIFSDSLNGSFYRYLMEGEYDMQFAAEGYESEYIENFAVRNGERVFWDIKLNKINSRDIVYPNPFKDEIYIELKNDKSSNVEYEISVFNNVGKEIFSNTIYDTSGVPQKITLPMTNQGVYYLKVIGAKNSLVYKIIKQ